MATPAQQLYQFLVDQGEVGGDSGWTGYIGVMPDDPDQVVAIFQTPGQVPDENGDDTGLWYEYPGIQIRIRGSRYSSEDVLTKIYSVVASIEGAHPDRFVFVHANESGPTLLRFDAKDRPEYVWNFKSMWTQASVP